MNLLKAFLGCGVCYFAGLYGGAYISAGGDSWLLIMFICGSVYNEYLRSLTLW